MSETQQSIISAYKKLTSNSAWEATLRQNAAMHVETHGLPHKKIEAWKYTSLFQLQTQSFDLIAAANLSESQLQQFNLPDTPRLVCVNGYYSPELSTAKEVAVYSIRELLKNQPEKLKPYFNQSISPNHIGFAETNTALFQDGLLIQIPDKQESQPLLLLFVTTEQTTPSMSHVRNIITLGKHSQTQFLEYHRSLATKPQLVSTINEIFVEDNACCQWTRCQATDLQQTHITETRVEQQRDSQFSHINLDRGGRIGRHDLQVNLNQPGAACALYGLYAVAGMQHIDNHTTINHQVSDTTSFEHYKGIIDDAGRAVFNGRVVVHPNAQRVVTEQHNPNILLSKSAEVDTKPQLEISNDNVKASHGATVGQLDENAIFYLQSRGLDRERAITALLQGFNQEIIAKISLCEWQNMISRFFRGETTYECSA